MNELIEKLKGMANWTTVYDDSNLDLSHYDVYDAFDTGVHDGEAKLARELLTWIHNHDIR